MKKISNDLNHQLLGLMLYHLFKKPVGLDAYCIATQIGVTEVEQTDPPVRNDEINPALKAWIEFGCKVNLCWLENKGDLHEMTMTIFELEKLRNTDRESYDRSLVLRKKASQRWSNDWKAIRTKVLTAEALYEGRPAQNSLLLTWQSVQTDCARKLQQMNKQEESAQILKLSLEGIRIKGRDVIKPQIGMYPVS